ncbi:MAG: hypothetical protein R3B48_02465 [Kofleriaceae bacterium]
MIVPILALPLPALADTFGGFSSVDASYLVNQDRVCQPLVAEAGVARGAPSCAQAAADRLAHLAFKPGAPQRGAKATFSASARGNALVLSRVGGGEVARWESFDPISRVVEVFADHEDRVAVTYLVRRAGREVTSVLAFDLRKPAAPVAGAPGTRPGAGEPGTSTARPGGAAPTGAPVGASGPQPGATAPAPAVDPALERAVVAARKQKGARARKAWQAVLTLAPDHAEGLVRSAAAALAARQRAQALELLDKLAASTRADAIEWRVAARFDPAFASVRGDPAFRKSVGLDRPATTPYEKAMGLGGTWEQSGTSCDSPTVALTFTREKTFRLQVRSVCEGMVNQSKFAGRWKEEGDGLLLILPNRGREDDQVRCRFEPKGDEEALRCPLDVDLQLVVLPARR